MHGCEKLNFNRLNDMLAWMEMTAAKLMEDITVADACVDEIALEGLDGITLNSLWVRLQTRPGLYLRVDDVVKQHLWNLIFHNKELSFYTLPKPRETIDMHCLYIDKLPVNIVKKNAKNLYGSCADFNKRVDITRTFRRTKRYEMYDSVIAKYGDSLVVVASQDLRTTAITGPCYSSELFTKDLSFALYFPVVERIARSRYFGCVTYGNYSLHKMFKIRSKDVFYTLKRLVALKLPCEVQLEDGSSRICTCVCLKRFVAFFKYFPFSRMISYLKSCPQRRATRSQIIKAISVEPFLFDIAKFRMINVLSVQIHQVKVPVHVGKKARNHQSKGENEIRDTCYRLNRAIEEDCCEDIVEKNGQKSADQEEIDDRLFELCCEDQDMEDEWMIVKNLDSVGEDDEQQLMEEELIDEISDLYEENNWLEDITSDEEDEESCSSDESEDSDDDDYITNTSNYQFKYFQNERHAIVRKLHNAGSDGVDHFQLCRQIGIHDKLLRALMPILCEEGHARTEFENDGRKRRLRYYTVHSESHTSHCFQQLFEKTNIDFQSVKFGNSPVTDRSCKRLLMILDLLEEKRVLTAQTLTKHIKDTEKEEGYNYEIDKRCSSGLFDLLEELKLIKVYQTLLIRGNKKKTVKFLCHVDVQPNDSDLAATIRKERIQFIGTVKANNCSNKSRKRRRSAVSPQQEVPKMKKTDKKNDEKKNLHTENKTMGPKPPFSMPSQFRQVTKLKRDIFNYGYQAKCIRLQSVHEFVFYLVHDYRGDTTKNKLYQAEPSCSVEMEDRSIAEPTVFLDELSWRRFLPPLPKQNDISHCWLRISDLLSVLPLSIAIQIYSPDKHVQGLMDYLEDPIKRHYLVLDLPEEMRGDMFNSGKLRIALSEVMDKLCFLGLLSQGPRKAQDHSCLLDVFYFVHSGGYLLDTSTSTCGYAVVSMPVTRYVEYRHDFDELDDLYLYWVHLRSIVLSTPLGFKAMRNKRQKVTALKTNELLNILPRSTLEETMPIVKKPIEPRIGSAGFIPQLFLHRHSQWVISTINGCGQYVYDHIAALLRKYTTTIIDCVQFFNRTYNLAYIQMKSYKGVVRQRSAKYFSPHNVIRRMCFYMSGTKKRNVPLYNKKKFYAAVKRKGVAVRGQQRRIRQVRVDYGKADFSTEEWTLSALSLSLNANSKYEQLLNIYRSFPDEVVTDVPSRLRNDDIITIMFDVVMRREQMTLTNHDYSPDVEKMPICIPDEDCDDDINENESKRKCLKIVDTVQQSLPDLLASEPNIRSTNRIVLLALRKARLISLGNCDLRSLNTKVQELRLKFSDVYVYLDKSKLSYEQARSSLYSRRKLKLALENVTKVFPVDTTEHCLTNNRAVKLFEKISKLGYSGIKLSEAQTLMEECSKNEEALKLLLKKKMIVIAGLNVPRFVSRKCIKPWGVHTFHDFHSTNSFVKNQKTPVDNDENDDSRINTFMMPRLWLMPDGELNWPVLRWCCEVIYLHILRSPGLTEESLMKELMPGFYPCITFEIIMFLVDIGCLTRHVFTVKRKRFTIFDVEIGNSVEVISLEPTPNGQDILYKTFEKIPLPDCMKQQELTRSLKRIFFFSNYLLTFQIMIGNNSSTDNNNEADFTYQPHEHFVSAPTAWLRLKSIFLKNEYGFDSFEWKAVKNSTLFTFIIGTMMAGTAELPLAHQRFKEQHSLSLFANKYEAIRRLQSHLLVSFWKSGIRLGLRIGFFTFSYTCALACLAAYEDQLKGFHFVFSGALAGALYRINMGLRASFAAGVIGGVLGLCSSAVIVCPALFISKKSLDEAYKQVRDQHFRESLQAIKNNNEIYGIQKQFNVSKWEARAILKARQQEQLLTDPSLNVSKN
ncbi:General transcription factor 3C polypeptide 1 [Trichinella nelsoni]|uniref:General transcription factor 3C polypeptide 1 n=1 Tax=Trichinella nelsoni TaxID=6336 RepID=A0A0V0RXV3_9BILA|nr:General transcription factor 3C polypeptide 1 [Trichinella nelsoni]